MLRNESRPPAVLAARQLQQLQALVEHAQTRVPFYRDLYAAQGIRPGSFRSMRDLQSLPIVDKQLLRAAGTALMSLDAPSDTVTINTSGTTGEPFEFRIDRSYDQWRKAQYLRPYLSTGRRLRDKVLRLSGRPKLHQPWYFGFGLLRELRLDCAGDPADVLEAWQQFSPDILQSYPSALRALAHYCLEHDRPLRPAPRLVYTDSELLLPDTRALLERAFGISPIDIFGTFETDNIAYQCAERSGYHVTTDSVALEIVANGKPVPIGQEGEIVVTALRNHTTPIIRYNLGDIGRLSPEPCACGRPFPVLSVFTGRSNDLAVLANGRRCTPQGIFARFNNYANIVQRYQLRQSEVGSFEFLFVPAKLFSSSDLERMMSDLRATLGDSRIELRQVDRIASESSGKFRLFVSQLPVELRR